VANPVLILPLYFVPIDFSPGSLRALDYALAMVDSGGEVYLLHVIDADFLERVSDEDFCDAETARAQMQRKAEEQLRQIAQKFSLLNVRIESMSLSANHSRRFCASRPISISV
jgi:nucleotide-binding universal stress UspA family protein